MQFITHHNSPQSYSHLVESNFIHKDDNTIHKPPTTQHYTHNQGYGDMVQYNGQFFTNLNSKSSHDHFEYTKHMLDNFYDPVHNNELIHNSSFINNRNENPFKNGDAQRFHSYDPEHYSNNYATFTPNDHWEPYINPKKNIEAFVNQQVVKQQVAKQQISKNADQVIKNADQLKMIESHKQNINTFYPQDINPYSNFLKDFNPSDNYITGQNNFNMNNGNDTPLNQLQPPVNVNIPKDAPSNVITSPSVNLPPPENLMTQSLSQLANNLAQKSMDIINDIVKYVENYPPTADSLWDIFIRPDRIAYVGILIIILAILWAIIS